MHFSLANLVITLKHGVCAVRTRGSRPLHLHALPDQVSIAKLDLLLEYVLVVNSSAVPVSLDGWVVESNPGGQRYTFGPGSQLQPGGCIVVTSGSEETQASAEADVRAELGDGVVVERWTKRYVWNNEGDAARLLGPDGEVRDEVETSWCDDDAVVAVTSRQLLAHA